MIKYQHKSLKKSTLVVKCLDHLKGLFKTLFQSTLQREYFSLSIFSSLIGLDITILNFLVDLPLRSAEAK